jgi:hypothetical protein
MGWFFLLCCSLVRLYFFFWVGAQEGIGIVNALKMQASNVLATRVMATGKLKSYPLTFPFHILSWLRFRSCLTWSF